MAKRKDVDLLAGVSPQFTPPSTLIRGYTLMTDTVVIDCGSAELAEQIELCIESARRVVVQSRRRQGRGY